MKQVQRAALCAWIGPHSRSNLNVSQDHNPVKDLFPAVKLFLGRLFALAQSFLRFIDLAMLVACILYTISLSRLTRDR